MDGTYRFPTTDGSGRNRENQEQAFRLLKEAGYDAAGRQAHRCRDGSQLSFEILAASTSQEALLLSFARDVERLGIEVKLRVVDGAQYQAAADELRLRHDPEHVAVVAVARQRAAVPLVDCRGDDARHLQFRRCREPRGRRHDPAPCSRRRPRTDFVSSVRALDRVLLSGDYVIPLFYMPKQWVAYWTRLKQPDTTPLFGYNVESWWSAEAK